MKKNNKKHFGFTLTETVVAIAIIGIISLVVIPTFIPKVKDRLFARQVSVAKIKFTEAMEQMMAEGKIAAYYSDTEDFVNELQNHLKIVKVCNNEHFEDCFGYEEMTTKDNTKYALSNAKTGQVFGMPKDSSNDYTKETVGILTLDGTAMIISWNRNCPRLDPGMYEWSGDTNIATGCVAALIDVNGNEKPNKMGKDIALLNAIKFDNCDIKFTYKNKTYCWGLPFPSSSLTPMSYSECLEKKQKFGIQTCSVDGDDYWGAVVRKCGGKSNMPSPSDLAALASLVYNTDISSGHEVNNIVLDETVLQKISPELYNYYLNEGKDFLIQSNEEYAPTDGTGWVGSYLMEFADTYTHFGGWHGRQYPGKTYGVCKMD